MAGRSVEGINCKSNCILSMASFSGDDKLVLLERDSTSITVGWEAVEGAVYELSIKSSSAPEWKVLSASLANNFVKKKNLEKAESYFFRVRSKKGEDWSDYVEVEQRDGFYVVQDGVITCSPPEVDKKDTESVTLKWSKSGSASDAAVEGFKVRMRCNKEINWTELGGGKILSVLTVRKKGLVPNNSYYFGVYPVLKGGGVSDYSTSCGPVTISDGPELTANMKFLMPTSLHCKTSTGNMEMIQTAPALAGKIVALYFSASWCGPCRQFTPILEKVYREAQSLNLPFEVVFCSADHTEEEFKSYYGGHHPWMAIPFEDDCREPMMGKFSVKGIPQLSIMAPNCRIIEQNATQSMSIEKVKQWVSQHLTVPGTVKSQEKADASHAHDHSHGHSHEHGSTCNH